MPGGIDVHTHLDMPYGGTATTDDFETGTIAAAHGGTTTVIDFATPAPGDDGLYPAFEAWMRRAEGKSVVDFGFHMVARELTDRVSRDMENLIRRDGVTSFKMFMAYPGRLMADDGAIFRALRKTREHGGLVCVHAENGWVIEALVRDALARGEIAPKHHALTRPPQGEGEATGRAIALADMAGAPVYIVHVSCAEAAEQIRRARDRGLAAFGET